VELDWSFLFSQAPTSVLCHEPQSPISNSLICFFKSLVTLMFYPDFQIGFFPSTFITKYFIHFTFHISFCASNMADCVISCFRHEADKNCVLLGYYIDICGNSLPTFRDKLSVPSWRVKNPRCIITLKIAILNITNYISCYKSYCSTVHFRRITSIY